MSRRRAWLAARRTRHGDTAPWLHALITLACFACCASRLHAITLQQALARTLEENPAIQEAKARLEEAAGRRLILRARSLPDARIGAPAGVQGGERAGEREVQPFAFGVGAFSQPLFQAAIPASYRRGNIEVLLAQQRLNLVVLEQLHSTRLAFYTAAHHASLGAVGEAQRERLENNFRTQSERFEAGKSNRAAVATARLLEQELTPRLEEFRRTRNGALLQLARNMGEELGPGAQLPRPEGALQFAVRQVDIAAEAAAALQRRPDLELARHMIAAAAEDQRIIEAAYYPAIEANISGTYIPISEIRSGSEGSARRSDDIVSSEARFGGVYSWRVVDNGRVRGAGLRERAAREINQAVLARLEGNVPRELTRISNNLRSLAARHNALRNATAVAEQTVNVVQNSLAEGLSSQLEYRTAESSFLETKAAVLAVAFEQNLALAELDRVTGRYFQFADDTRAKLR